MIVWWGPALPRLWATDLHQACQSACASDFFYCDCLCLRPQALSHLMGSRMCVWADNLKDSAHAEKIRSPFLVKGKTQGRWKSAGEVAPWPFPLVSMSRGRKEGSETESGNQRATLPAFQYKSRRSLKNLNSNSLVDGYDCIFVNVGILENMLLTACQAWLVACK